MVGFLACGRMDPAKVPIVQSPDTENAKDLKSLLLRPAVETA